MDRTIVRDGLGWGFLLWFFGYVLGILLFFVVSPVLLGWVIMPVGILVTLWVLFKKIKGKSVIYYFKIALIWTALAVAFDYFFLVQLFKPADGYYKLDVYIYYIFTFALPLFVASKKGLTSR